MNCGGWPTRLLAFGSQVVLLICVSISAQMSSDSVVWEAFANICYLEMILDTFTEIYMLERVMFTCDWNKT